MEMTPDRERVIDHLRILWTWCKVSLDCGAGLSIGEIKNAALWLDETLDFLKAQEPKLVHVIADISRRKIGKCPTCGKLINSEDYPNYCGRCGQKVKWE